jgi:hypothetical protein
MINGFVYDRTGLPVVNATVTLYLDNVPLHTASNPAITDVHGYYEFIGIQQGIYCLVAEKNNYPFSRTIYIQALDKMVNFTLQGSASDLADIHTPPMTPSPSPAPEIATATPEAPEATPEASAAPGFEAVKHYLC